MWACKPHPQYDFEFLEGALMESRHEDILSEIKLGDPQSTLATARQCNIIPDLLKVPMKDEVSYIYIYIYLYLYHDGATLQSELPWYITDTLPRVVYFTLMFDILPACG